MNKIITLAMLVALTTSASAQVQFDGRTTQKHVLRNNAAVTLKKAPRHAQSDIITDQPEGEAVRYTRGGQSLVVYDGVLYAEQQSGTTTIVYAEDGTTAYIQNLVYGMREQFGDSWARGTLSEDGTKLTVPLNQTVGWSYQFDAGIRLIWGKTVINEDNNMVSFQTDESVTEVVYAIEGNTLTLQGTSGRTEFEQNIHDFVAEGLACCYEDDGAWPGYLEWNTVLTEKIPVPVPDIISEQPAGLLKSYVRSGANIYQGWDAPAIMKQTGTTDIVYDEDGETVYLREPVYDTNSDIWVKGTINADGTKITVPLNQYLYWDENEERGMVIKWMSTGVEQQTDEEGNVQYTMTLTVHQGVTEATYTINGNTITLDNTVGDMDAEFPNNYNATGLGVVYDTDLVFCAMDFGTVYNEFILQPAVPADPILYEDSWFDDGTEDGYNCLDFKILPEDVDGNYIDLKYTAYSVYTDDDIPFVFEAATYINDLEEDLTDVPYSIYSTGYDFNDSRIYFYRTNMGDNPLFLNRIGLQVHYDVPVVGEDGETTIVRNSSNIVYWEKGNSAVTEVKAATAGDNAYYNLMGQKFSGNNLPAGIYIHNGRKVIVR